MTRTGDRGPEGPDAEELIEQARRDVGGAFLTGLAYIGDRLGLFAVLAEHGPCDSFALAEITATHERYLREWLEAMAVFGYAQHDPADGTFWMTAEQRAVLADESSPVFAAGMFHFALPSLTITDRILEAFREGGGVPYEELPPEVPEAIDRMHRPWFDHLLTGEWLPSIPGLVERLEGGADVLDIGCGGGRSTVAIASAWPACRVVGVEPHPASLDRAIALAGERGTGNARFVGCTLQDLATGPNFDLVLAIDCVHDMADPVGALVATRRLLADDGLFVWSEAPASDNPLENTDALAKVRAALSPFHCLAVSLAEGGPGIGTLMGEGRARELAAQAGFDTFENLPIDSAVQVFYGLRRGS